MISDGTIRLLSVLLALLNQPLTTDVICVDEPERYLHPQVFQPLTQLMRDISNEKQIIVTTHSAELVKHLLPSEVFMVDKVNNVTRIVNAKDVQMVDKFLEEFSLDELWLKGYLEGGRIS
jgi:predicted ATPase